MIAHYTNFGIQYAPQCADKDGFIKFNASQAGRLALGLPVSGKETDGTMFVGGITYAINKKRSN